jgi:ABC-type multidrug transport system fused ATPase/permease subunit
MRGHTGKRISKMQKGFNALKNLIFETFFWIVPTAFLVITTIIFLFIKNHIFGFIALGVTILYGIGVALYWKNYKRPILKWNESGHRYFGEYSDLIRNSQEIKVASGQSLNIRHMYRKKKVHNHGKKMYWGMCTRETFLDLGGSISIIFVTALSVVMLKTGGLTTGDFFIMFLWFSRVVKNLGRSTGMLRNVMNNIASIDNLLDMLIESAIFLPSTFKFTVALNVALLSANSTFNGLFKIDAKLANADSPPDSIEFIASIVALISLNCDADPCNTLFIL